MKRGVVFNIPVTEGELTIVMAADAARVMKHSCELAKAAGAAGTGVLVVNTGLSKRRFKEAAAEVGIELNQVRDTNAMVAAGKTTLIVQNSVAGELSSELMGIRKICEEAKIKIVVITGWEWTSSNYRRKEQLLFGLRRLLDELDIAVVVYSQSPAAIECGKYSRGGVGKLAMIAYDVIDLEVLGESDEAETDLGVFVGMPKPQPVIAGGEQLSARKINQLQGVFADSERPTSPPAPLLINERGLAKAA